MSEKQILISYFVFIVGVSLVIAFIITLVDQSAEVIENKELYNLCEQKPSLCE